MKNRIPTSNFQRKFDLYKVHIGNGEYLQNGKIIQQKSAIIWPPRGNKHDFIRSYINQVFEKEN